MADEIEIKNVGDGGVASEATLKALLSAVEKMGSGKGGNAAKVQELHNKAVQSGIKVSTKNRDALNKNTKSVKKSTKAVSEFGNKLKGAVLGGLGAVANNLMGLGNELIAGGNRITDFTQHLPIVGTLLSPFANYLQGSLDAFRQVSDSGASFSNSMMQVTVAAAQAGMKLEEFTAFVTQNASTMALFGAGAGDGAKNFARLSKELRSGVGKDLFNLGFTIGDLNDGLVTTAELQARQIGRERINTAQLVSQTQSYLVELDKLATLTGKSRKEMQEEMSRNANDIRVRVALTRMTNEQQERFNTNLAAAGAVNSQFSEVLRDMADDRPDQEVTKRFMTQSETFRRFASEIENMNPAQLQEFTRKVGEEVDAFAQTIGTGVEAMDEPTQQMLGMAADLSSQRRYTAEELKAMEEERGKRDKVTDAMADFESVVSDIRFKIQSALVESGIFDSLGTSLNSFKEILEKPEFKEALASLTTQIGNITGKILNFFNEFAAAENPGEFLKEKLTELGSAAMETISTTLKDAITNGITSIWENSSMITKIALGAAGLFTAGSVISSVTNGIKGLFGGGGGDKDTKGGGKGGGGNSRLGKALEGLGGGLLRGIATGLIAFANPLVPVGAAAVGAAVVAIGAGIAGATWLMGEALPNFSAGIKTFEDLNGEKLSAVGDGITSLGVGLVAFGAGNVASAIGGITEMFAGFLGADSPADKIADMAEKLKGVDSGTFATFGSDLEKFNINLDADKISTYADAIEELAEALGKLNEVLADKNSGFGESDVSVASMIKGGQSIGGGSGMSEEQINQLNTTMSLALGKLTEIKQVNDRQLSALNNLGDVY